MGTELLIRFFLKKGNVPLATEGRGTKGVKVTKDCYVHAYMHVVLSEEGKKMCKRVPSYDEGLTYLILITSAAWL